MISVTYLGDRAAFTSTRSLTARIPLLPVGAHLNISKLI